jgi:hypothetical protein
MLSESQVTSLDRLAAAEQGYMLFRNQSGALKDKRGRLIRFGLGHESSAQIEQFKTSDYIGWRPRLITPDMIGDVIAQFVAREYKPQGWHLTPGDKRGQAQARFGALVTRDGGEFRFVTGE